MRHSRPGRAKRPSKISDSRENAGRSCESRHRVATPHRILKNQKAWDRLECAENLHKRHNDASASHVISPHARNHLTVKVISLINTTRSLSATALLWQPIFVCAYARAQSLRCRFRFRPCQEVRLISTNPVDSSDRYHPCRSHLQASSRAPCTGDM